MTSSSFDSCAQPRAPKAWTCSLACALAGLLAAPTARAERPGLSTRPANASTWSEVAEPLPALEQANDADTYQRVTALAAEEWNAGRWAEARALFLLAHGLRPSALTLRAAGQAAFELRMYPEAVRELSAALKDPRQALDPTTRSEVRGQLQHADAFVSRCRIALVPVEAQVRVDGNTPLLETDGSVLLTLGWHQVEIEANGYLSERREIVVTTNGKQTLTFRLTPDVKPLPSYPGSDEDELLYHASTAVTPAGAVALAAAWLTLSPSAYR